MNEIKYHIVQFEIYSQGRNIFETYKIGLSKNGTEIGNKLVNWFNLTGGNRDGSKRKFIRCSKSFGAYIWI